MSRASRREGQRNGLAPPHARRPGASRRALEPEYILHAGSTPEDGKPAADEEQSEEKPDPAAAAAALSSAQQELTVLIDLIGSVESQQAVNVQYVDNGRSKLDAFLETTLLVEQCKQKLKAGAARLRVAAGQLRQQMEQGNVFVHELSRLQACFHCYTLFGAIASFLAWALCPC